MQTDFPKLNALHPSLVFTYKKEIHNSVSFLDVLVEKSNKKFLTSVYRKPTFTDRIVHALGFIWTRKTNLIGTLVYKALEICFPEKLLYEANKIQNILQQNGYPEEIINSGMKKKISNFQTSERFGPEKCPVYLKLLWIGNISLKYEKQS